MTTYTTTCPHCQAKFLINTEQLNLRGGKARCGNCSKVFQANENLSHPQASKQEVPTEKPQTNFEQALMEGQESHSTAGVAKKQQKAESDFDELMNASLSNQPASTTHINDVAEPASTKEESQLFDDSTALFDDDMEFNDDFLTSSTKNKTLMSGDISAVFEGEIASEFKDTMSNMPAVDPFDISITDQKALKKKSNDISDEKWVEALLSDDEPEADVPQKSKKEQSDDLIGFLEDIGANTAQFSAVSPSQLANHKDPTIPDFGTETPKKIEPTRNIRKKTSSFKIGKVFSSLLWTLLTLASLIALAGQYLYFNFDTLARDSQGREYLSQACGYVGCVVPNINADAIAFKEVTTTEAENGSNLSFVIHNHSQEATLFPSVKVLLYKGSKVVGGNVIAPNQYLQGSYKKLPARQPIDGKVNLGISKSSYNGVKLEAVY